MQKKAADLAKKSRAHGRGGNWQTRHGVYALLKNGLDSMTEDEKSLYAELLRELETPDGVAEHIRRRAARSLIVIERIEAFIGKQIEKGQRLDRIKLLDKWPQFQNSTSRALKDARGVLPGVSNPHDDELRRIERAIEPPLNEPPE